MAKPSMTVQALYEVCDTQTALKVMGAYNGRVLCRAYDPEKHTEIGKRYICALWADIELQKIPFGNSARPVLCCYVAWH